MVSNAFNSGYTIDSYNVLPVDVVGTNYVISSYTNLNTDRGSEVLVAGIHSDTNVTLFNDTDVLYETTLQPFDIFQYRSDRAQHIDLTGFRVQSSKNVFVVSGAAFIKIPSSEYGQDYIASELYPVEAMSTTFIVPPIPPKQLYMVRVQSDNPSKVTIFNDSSPFYPSPAPFYTNSSLTDYTFGSKPVVIIADEPVSVAQYGISSYQDTTGDPFMTLVPSIEQYVNDIKFSVPNQIYATESFVSVIVPKAHALELQMDSKSILMHGGSVTKLDVPAPFDNYTVLSFRTSPGFHRMNHVDDDVTFGVLVLGIGYELSLGFYPGYNLHGDCTRPVPTVPPVTTPRHGYHFGDGQWCYNCEDMTHIELCDTVKLCSNSQMCYVASEILSGRLVYRTGCLEKLTCQQISNTTSNICIECCQGSFCNFKGCGDKGLPDRSHRGPICFDCHQVLSPEECTTVTMCEPQQVCGIEEFPWAERSFYKMGCSNQLCDRLQRSTPLCKSCCNEDYCNYNCTTIHAAAGPNVLIG
ncbi:hypothetical protein ACF0H5_020929 [Mactra antiquata]